MDRHSVGEHGNADTYLIPGAETNQLIARPNFEKVEKMYSERVPEFVVDQGMYFPTATNYGYYCTGFGMPTEFEDRNRVFGIDGPKVQYTGIQSESLPYVYYSPSYGYAETAYNPYNPYIPGAMIGVDGPFPGAQHYYPLSPYHNSVSSPAYYSVLVPPDMNSSETLSDHSAANVSRLNGRTQKNNFAPASNPFSSRSSKVSSNTTNSMNTSSEIPRDNVGHCKPAISHGSISTVARTGSSRVLQGRNVSSSMQQVDHNFSGKAPSLRSQVDVGFSAYGGSANRWSATEKSRPRAPTGRQEVVSGSLDLPGEQNRGPRTSRPKSQFAVNAYTKKAGDSNAQGIIVTDIDRYNKDSFSIDYEDAKFFVIKSYSEDDVHKSIKYNVWSSTPHGNKKLQSAYEDAQKIAAGKPKGCPIFLFFSVNASGQFCGVAEMIGPVDSFKDMDFWQQDKWSGSLSVKWHMIKDVQNSAFRHIILENNENKPVTNSRDTQEIMYKQGLEMLKIFKNHSLKTSILDDFMYYENRQKMMQEERARLLVRSFHTPFSVPILDPPRRLMNMVSGPPSEGRINEQRDISNPRKSAVVLEKVRVPSNLDVTVAGPTILSRPNQQKIQESKDDAVSSLKVGSLTISPLQAEPVAAASPSTAAGIAPKSATQQTKVVTMGSTSFEVNGFSGTSGSLTVGSILLDGRALKGSKDGAPTRVTASAAK